MTQRQTVLGLLLLEENATIKGKLDKEQVSRLSQTLLLDLIVNTVQSGSTE